MWEGKRKAREVERKVDLLKATANKCASTFGGHEAELADVASKLLGLADHMTDAWSFFSSCNTQPHADPSTQDKPASKGPDQINAAALAGQHLDNCGLHSGCKDGTAWAVC